MAAENVQINFNFRGDIKDVWNIYILDTIFKGGEIFKILLILGIHEGKKQRLHMLLHILDLVNGL